MNLNYALAIIAPEKGTSLELKQGKTHVHPDMGRAVATEEADHAQVEGSSAATIARTEPTPACPRLFDLTEHSPRIRVGGLYLSTGMTGR
jgi:hypothetical protein